MLFIPGWMASVPAELDFNALLDKDDVDSIFSLEVEIASGSFGTVYKVSWLLVTGSP